MTTINIRPDDAGIRNLRDSNTKPATAKEVDAVPAYPETHPIKGGITTPVERREQEKQSQQKPQQQASPDEAAENTPQPTDEQRKSRRDRRQKQIPVILDTRSGQERRSVTRNTEETTNKDEEKDIPRLGIDIYT